MYYIKQLTVNKFKKYEYVRKFKLNSTMDNLQTRKYYTSQI